LGLRVTCFAQNENWGADVPPTDFEIVRPWLRRGCRWDWPGRCLAWQIRRQFRRTQPDFVFVIGVTSLARYLLQCDMTDKLLIWELTNANPGNKFVDIQASRLLGRARAVLSPSAMIDQEIRRTYAYAGPLLRLAFWIEDEQKSTSPPPQKYLADFIYLGRRDEEKGLKELVQATSEMAKFFPSIRVLIAGSGTEQPYAVLAQELSVNNNIAFQFFESRGETLAALANSRCLVLPSYHEGYPLVLLEAAQRSIPCIATSVGSVREMFAVESTADCEMRVPDGAETAENSQAAADGLASILIPPRNVPALAEAMRRVLSESPETYLARRRAAHSCFARHSSAGAVRAGLANILSMAETCREQPRNRA
jgi:glycosyltransferase involved in cell wall biosynthesis